MAWKWFNIFCIERGRGRERERAIESGTKQSFESADAKRIKSAAESNVGNEGSVCEPIELFIAFCGKISNLESSQKRWIICDGGEFLEFLFKKSHWNQYTVQMAIVNTRSCSFTYSYYNLINGTEFDN